MPLYSILSFISYFSSFVFILKIKECSYLDKKYTKPAI